jgi:hypothetical protein
LIGIFEKLAEKDVGLDDEEFENEECNDSAVGDSSPMKR